MRQYVKGLIADWRRNNRNGYGLSLIVRCISEAKAGLYERSFDTDRAEYDLLVIISYPEAEELVKNYRRYRVGDHIWS